MIYDKDYYIDSDISNYKNYLDKHFEDIANDIIASTESCDLDFVLDFGCATGGLVNAFIKKGIDCYGTDISYWAINKGREKYGLQKSHLQHYNRYILEIGILNLIIFLDVLEHIDDDEIKEMLSIIYCKKIFIRIPVSKNEGEDYFLECSRNDITHKEAHSKQWWLHLFALYGYSKFTPIVLDTVYDGPGVMVGIFEKL